MNFSTSAKATISSNFRLISDVLHAQDRAAKKNVLAACQLGMESGTYFKQTTYTSPNVRQNPRSVW